MGNTVKHILITGPQGTGKTTLAKRIAGKAFSENEIVIIGFHPDELKNPFFFRNCTKETKCIIIEELSSLSQIELFYNFLDGSVIVNKRHQRQFEIYPTIILVLQNDVSSDVISRIVNLKRRLTVFFT